MPLLASPAEAVPRSDSFIVVLKQSPGARSATDLARQYGGTITHRYEHVLSGYSATMTADQARRVAGDPSVASVVADGIVPMPRDRAVRHAKEDEVPWGLDRIDQANLPLDGSYNPAKDGRGVTVYVVDSGVREIPDQFGDRLKTGYNATGDSNGTTDCVGHGTGVASVAGSKDYGVAKAVDLVPVRVGGCGAATKDSTLIAAIDWITVDIVRPAVVNLSVGAPAGVTATGADSLVESTIKKSIANGVPWVIAAGNEAIDACKSPMARIPEVITVGATESKDAMWVKDPADPNDDGEPGSNYGKCVDIMAPGKDIEAPGLEEDAIYSWTGTSDAAPHVTGAAAMYLADHTDAPPAQVANALMRTSTKDVLTGLSGSPNRLLHVEGAD
ncbi:S8 family peptidase [Kutzneria buriramensis]|uniref:Peptidase inhibitor I9 n=2 Tax=Kutzneria buriramensis TaxID=1045776 RepID=A0A3E0GYU7_9PSEU|nr:S8 family peptidase [Kutzneria buriramensis]REH34925.1 peptidase inhibitor I9 [Kutzneria buriramensis]